MQSRHYGVDIAMNGKDEAIAALERERDDRMSNVRSSHRVSRITCTKHS